MSYIRGDYYSWVGTLSGSPEEIEGRSGRSEEHDYIQMNANGRSIEMPLEIFDELVAMRYAEMIEEGIIEDVELRAIEKYDGNIGSWALQRKHGKDPGADLKAFLDKVKKEKK